MAWTEFIGADALANDPAGRSNRESVTVGLFRRMLDCLDIGFCHLFLSVVLLAFNSNSVLHFGDYL